MSRLIKKPLEIPPLAKVEVLEGTGKFKGAIVKGKVLRFKGPKGEVEVFVPPLIGLNIDGNRVSVNPPEISSLTKADRKLGKALPGTLYRLIRNAISGVIEGYKIELKVIGTGYRVRKEGEKLVFNVGYSHAVEYTIPEDYKKYVKVDVQGQDTVIVSGTNKEMVGLVAAQIRSIKEPNTYTGKGIRYADEVIVLKPTKKTKAK